MGRLSTALIVLSSDFPVVLVSTMEVAKLICFIKTKGDCANGRIAKSIGWGFSVTPKLCDTGIVYGCGGDS